MNRDRIPQPVRDHLGTLLGVVLGTLSLLAIAALLHDARWPR